VDEKTRKQRILEEQFIDEKKKIDSGIETINEKMNEFRKEDNRLMENFIQYTQNDEVNINELDWKLRDIEDGFLQEANKSIFKLEEVASELNKEYEKALLELDK
jgi:predicted nuclease with TOPRIM domain